MALGGDDALVACLFPEPFALEPLAKPPAGPGQPDGRACEPREGARRLGELEDAACDAARGRAAGETEPRRPGPRVYACEHGSVASEKRHASIASEEWHASIPSEERQRVEALVGDID